MDIPAKFETLLAENPSLHGEAAVAKWQLAEDVMRWLFATVTPKQRTLETGCGYSTIIFALKQAQHTVISPVPEEHQRIRAWCEVNGVDLSNVHFRLARSERILPSLVDEGYLDLVLIDGWHAFPAPFIDWMFTAERLKTNGLVILDDTQIKSVRLLRDFLEAEHGRWELFQRFDRTDVFRKITTDVFVGDWRTQPYGAKPYLTWRDILRSTIRPKLVAAVRLVPSIERVAKAVRNRIYSKANEKIG